MRKISKEAHKAFIEGKRFKKANTEIRIENGKPFFYLHNRCIAKIENNFLWVSDGNYGVSNTTRDRLNAFPEVHVRINQGRFILNEQMEWDGEWLKLDLIV